MSRSFGGNNRGSRSFGGSNPKRTSSSSSSAGTYYGASLLLDGLDFLLSFLPIPYWLQTIYWLIFAVVWIVDGSFFVALGIFIGLIIITTIICKVIGLKRDINGELEYEEMHYSFTDEFVGKGKYNDYILQSQDFNDFVMEELGKRGYLDYKGQIIDEKIHKAREDFDEIYKTYVAMKG